MTLRDNQNTGASQRPAIRVGENPYLERIMRLLGIGLSIAVAIFALTGMYGSYSGARRDLERQHSSGISRVESAIQARLDRYYRDISILGSDTNIITHLAGSPNILLATTRATEIIQLNLDEYERVQFIEIENGEPFLAFDRINVNGVVSSINTYNDEAYTPPEQSADVFDLVLSGNETQAVLGDFYLEGNADNNRVILDAFVPVYIGEQAQPSMIINLKINTTSLRSIINLSAGELVGNDEDAGSRRVVLLSGTNRVIADSEAFGTRYIEELNLEGGNAVGNDYYESITGLQELRGDTLDPLQLWGSDTIYSSKRVTHDSFGDPGWRIIITDKVLIYYNVTIIAIVAIALMATLVSTLTITFIKNILRPILDQVYEADTLVQTIARESSVAVRSSGNHAELVGSARRITTRINKLTEDLERQSRRRVLDMQVAGRISRETATLTNLDELAKRSINLICNELGFYHAQIFLLDKSETNAVLRYSRGDAGQALIEQKHHLVVGSDTVVGTCSAEKIAVVVNDTQSKADAPHSVNPLLGDTRAEMGLPLLIGNRVIGVLDIQSRLPNVFIDQDIPTYQLLADQLAVAIHNARLQEESEQRIEQINILNRQLTRDAWSELEETLDLQEEYGTHIDQPKLSADITIRGQVLASLNVDLPGEQEFSEGDQQILQSVADRVSLAIENARLFQETQNTLAETSTLYELSRHLSEAEDLEDILQAIIDSIATHASGGQVWLFDDMLPGDSPDWTLITIDLQVSPREENVSLVGKRMQLSAYPFMERLSGNEIATVEDITALRNVRDDLREMFLSVNAVAQVFIPLNMRGAWKGFMSINYDAKRDFPESELRIFKALIAQAGVAIDNRLLLQQTEDALARQEKLYAASRIINTSQNLSDLVFAAVATTSDPRLDFWLGLMEGDADSEGWTNAIRIVARSRSGEVEESNEIQQIYIPEQSPMRSREPEILVDPGMDIQDVPAPVKWMRELDYKFMAIFPLFSDNNPIALFYIVNKESFDLSQDDYEVYRALTGQMSTQIQNRNLLTQTEETLNEIRRLYVATRAISGAQDMTAIYDAVAGHLAMPFIRQGAQKNEEFHISITVLLANPEPDIDAPQLRYEYFWSSDPTREGSIETGMIISQEDVPFGSLIADNDDGILVYHHMDDLPDDLPMLREILSANGATSVVVAPLWSRLRWFGVMIVHTDRSWILDDNYQRFMQSIADQVAIAVENQKLLEETQFERQNLNEILETLPVGVMVLDPETLKPISSNARVTQLLGREIDFDEPFSSASYEMYRTGTNLYYPNDELPMYLVRETGQQVVPADDAAIISGMEHTDLFITASPIFDEDGKQRAIIVALQDISTLRSMENTMQENLRETVLLYETQSALNEGESLDELLDALIVQLAMQEPKDAYLILRDEDRGLELARSMNQPIDDIKALNPLLQSSIVNIDDIERYIGLPDDTRRTLMAVGARSVIILPLIVRTRQHPLGWLIIVEEEPEAFTSDQERTLGSVSDMASQAIDNNYLVESTRIALEETEALYNANTAISSSRDRATLFNAIESLLGTLKPDMATASALIDGEMQEMFKFGFEESEAAGLDLVHLMQMPLPHSEGVYINDLHNAQGDYEVEVGRSGTIMAFAAVNLRTKDEQGGRLLLGYKQVHRFDTGEKRYLSAIADSASVVLDNQNLLVQVQSTLQETSVLYQASKALIDVDSPEEIVDVMVTYLIPEHIDQVFIAILNRTNWNHINASVNVVAGWQSDGNMNLNGITLSAEQFPGWSQLASEMVLTIDDIYDEKYGLSVLEQESIASLDAHSLVIMPLRVPGRNIGAIWMSSDKTYKYTDRDLRVFQSFAEQTSLSLEAKRLLEQTEQRARQLQTSAVISQSIGQILDLDVLLPQVVDLIKEQFEYDHVQIFLMDEDNDWALLRASTGEAGIKLLEIGHKLQKGSKSVIGQVTELGEASLALDTADVSAVHKPNSYLPMTRSEMALPMIVKGAIVGALDVQSNTANAFTEEDVQVLTTLASQIAVAIDNARLYEETEQSAEDMAFLFEMTTAAAAAETLDEALRFVVAEVRGNMRAELTAIYLPQIYEDYYGNQKQMIELVAFDSTNDVSRERMPGVEAGDVENIIGMVAGTIQPQIINNVERDVRYQVVNENSRSAIVLPISSGSVLVGVMVLENRRLNAYPNEILTLLQTLTGSLGAVIQNTLLVEQLQESVNQLREVDRLKSQFLASMSHELRTPLNSIIGFSRVMLKGIDGPLSEMQEQDLTTIYNSGNHLLRLINDILDQAKIEANELNLRFSYFDMKPLVESVKSIAIGLLKEKPELQFNVEVADGLPKVFGDEIRSRQILLNLVTNGIKFTQDGSVTIDVYAIEGDPAPMIKVDVIDTGMGIAEKDLPTVFEQFRQVDNSLTRTVGGTGLGLPISKSLAEMQGGELTVMSEVGSGSVFSVTIPTYEGADEVLERQREEKRALQKPVSNQSNNSTASGLISKKDIEEAKRRAEAQSPGGDRNGISDTREMAQAQEPPQRRIDAGATRNIPLMTRKRDVILVEDDKTMVDQFRRILQREGFEVTTADFATFAEAMIGQIRPSLVVLDVNFANGTGWELLKNLKERDDTFDIPVIVTTIDEDSERAYRLGAHTFIQRPFLPDDLLESVLKAEKESQRERILIIDDQEETIRLLTYLLEEHSDFKIFSAQSGDEGISLVARRHPDLIILDLRMPGKDGFAVLDELRGNPETAKIPVLVVTGEMDLSNDEQEQLIDIHVLQKTDISQEEYDLFIDNVRSYLEANNKKK